MTQTLQATRVRNEPNSSLQQSGDDSLFWELHPIADFDKLADQWDELVRSRPGTPFLEYAFLKPLLGVYGKGDELLCVAYTGGKVCAGAILRRTRPGIWETFQPSQLPLGAWISNSSVEIGTACAALMPELPGLVLGIGITQIDSRIQRRPADDSGRLRSQDYIQTAWVNIDGDFDVYWNARGKNLRQNVRKLLNKLGAESKVARMDCLTARDEVASAMHDYARLETTGWKGEQGTAIATDNAQGAFYRNMFEDFCSHGRGRIYRFWIDDKVVAMDLCVHDKNVLVILKTAYDESFKSYSPSTLMRYEEFRQLFSENLFHRIEFFGKVMEWHTRWASDKRDIFHMTFYRRHYVKALHELVSHLRKWAHSRYKPTRHFFENAKAIAGQSSVHKEPVER